MASRRRLLIVFLVTIGGACALGSRAPPTRRSLLKRSLALVSFPAAAHANWLTSRPLEQLRKLEQEAADAKYGELAPIDDGRGGGQRLVPILKLQAQIARIAAGAREPSRWPELRVELSSPSLRTQQMKKDFNVYSDNIYYADEARANAYLLGGTTPESAQTEQYLLRNEVIGAVQNAQREVDYLLEQAALKDGDVDSGDLVGYLSQAEGALAEYLRRAEKRDLVVAQRLLSPGGGTSSP